LTSDVKATENMDQKAFKIRLVVNSRIILYGEKWHYQIKLWCSRCLEFFCLLPFCIYIKIVDQTF